MSDTTSQECINCGIETDCIEGICLECRIRADKMLSCYDCKKEYGCESMQDSRDACSSFERKQ